MKVALLFPNNLFTSPYLAYFIRVLETGNTPYDIYSWNRFDTPEENTVAFETDKPGRTPLGKALDYLKFRKFLIQNLNRTEYQRVIVFTCQLGILMKDYLNKNFPQHYLLDIRDYSVAIPYFKNRFNQLVMNAGLVTISSPGFLEWLPKKGNYVVSHNVNTRLVDQSLSTDYSKKTYFQNTVKQISTIGQIKDFASDSAFVTAMKNYPDFMLNFIGFGPSKAPLEQFVKEQEVTNIHFHGAYEKKEEAALLENTDFINILISRNEANKGSSLLSNRLYLAALLRIPSIVNAHTEQSRIVEKYKLGIIVDQYEDLGTQLESYIKHFNEEVFIGNCVRFLQDIRKEYNVFEERIQQFLKDN